jgi:hypothetical protein
VRFILAMMPFLIAMSRPGTQDVRFILAMMPFLIAMSRSGKQDEAVATRKPRRPTPSKQIPGPSYVGEGVVRAVVLSTGASA